MKKNLSVTKLAAWIHAGVLFSAQICAANNKTETGIAQAL